jgi:hypothetical protein
MAAAHTLHYDVGIPVRKVPRVPKARYKELRQGVRDADRGTSYEAKAFWGVAQQKCHSHAVRSINEVLENKHGKARWFGTDLKAMLKHGASLWHDYNNGAGRAPAGRG